MGLAPALRVHGPDVGAAIGGVHRIGDPVGHQGAERLGRGGGVVGGGGRDVAALFRGKAVAGGLTGGQRREGDGEDPPAGAG